MSHTSSASGPVARRMIQATGSKLPYFRVKMFGMSVGVVKSLGYVRCSLQVKCMPIYTCVCVCVCVCVHVAVVTT